MPLKSYTLCDPQQTARLLDFPSLVAALERAAVDYAAGRIHSPERMVVGLPAGGVMLSMPATADDVAIHKLVNVQPANGQRGLPTIHGQVAVYEALTGEPLFLLDGPEVTGRRTAAVSMLAIRTLGPAQPQEILIIGTGTQAQFHIKAIQALYPSARVWVKGHLAGDAEAFCERHHDLHPRLQPVSADEPLPAVQVVITLTTSLQPVYDEPARSDRLIIGVGAFKPEMAEIGKTTLAGSDIYLDDPAGARHEAGDLIQAGIDWNATRSLAQALGSVRDPSRPVVFKSVGTGAWDLAACRVARSHLEA